MHRSQVFQRIIIPADASLSETREFCKTEKIEIFFQEEKFMSRSISCPSFGQIFLQRYYDF